MFGLKDLMRALRKFRYPRAKMQEPKLRTRFDYSQGPMHYLAQQTAREMEKAGYPCKILWTYRPPEKQAQLYAQGRTKPGKIVTRAKPWQSAHQLYEGSDLIHPSKAWGVSEDYWEALAACWQIVSAKHGVKVDHGHKWKFRDSAHCEIVGWRDTLERWGEVRRLMELPPALKEKELWKIQHMRDNLLWRRFEEVLPDKAKYLIRARRVPQGVLSENVGKYLPK